MTNIDTAWSWPVIEPRERPDIVVGEGDCLTLSPETQLWKHVYMQVRPQSIDEVRQILGPQDVAGGSSPSAVATQRCAPY